MGGRAVFFGGRVLMDGSLMTLDSRVSVPVYVCVRVRPEMGEKSYPKAFRRFES